MSPNGPLVFRGHLDHNMLHLPSGHMTHASRWKETFPKAQLFILKVEIIGT